tara:strand:- start:1155 stop:2312 length:1158 start_codon:yes stop_codon:yes gene_type:complete
MSGQSDNPALLPKGFADLLPPEAEGEARSILTLMKLFKKFGYERVKPPLVEFEDSLVSPGPGVRHATDTFRVMDPLSTRMLGLRSDLTAQIARLVTTRFDDNDMPIRMTYAGDVLRTKGGQLRTTRQFCQVGCEIITNDLSVNADIEICVLSILGLKSLGIQDITLDLNIPRFVDILLQDQAEDEKKSIKEAIDRRDQAAINEKSFKSAESIIKLIALNGQADESIEILENVSSYLNIKKQIQHLKEFYAGLIQTLKDYEVDDIYVSIDVLEQSGFEYHNTLGFTLFSTQARGELGRGGAYNIDSKHDGNTRTGHGFTLYMDTIGRSCSYDEGTKRVFVPFCTTWKEIKDLQEQDLIVIRALSKDSKPTKACSHLLVDGQIEKIS